MDKCIMVIYTECCIIFYLILISTKCLKINGLKYVEGFQLLMPLKIKISYVLSGNDFE
jgi:hypothetical protein